MDFSLLSFGLAHFHLRFAECFFLIFTQILIEYYVSKKGWAWSNTICILSVSSLLAYVQQQGRYAYMVWERVIKTNI